MISSIIFISKNMPGIGKCHIRFQVGIGVPQLLKIFWEV